MVLQGVSWTTYQALIRDLEAEPGKRLTYERGTLEIMVPLSPHERHKSRLSRMVEVMTEETETEYAPQEQSQVLPLLQRGDMLRFLQASQTMGETSWVREFRQWVREQIV